MNEFKDITYCQELMGFEDAVQGRLKDYPQSDIYMDAWRFGRECRRRHRNKYQPTLDVHGIKDDEQSTDRKC